MISSGVVTLGVALAATWFGAEARATDLLVRDARLIDGTGAPPRAPMSILIRDGRITEIAPVIRADGTPALDAGGATVLPGLMDMHVHFITAPGAGFRGDSRDTTRELNHQHLRAYLASGVTTVLDAGIDPESAREIQAWLAEGHPGPRFLTTGPYLRPPGGYGWPGFGEDGTPAAIEAKLDLIQSLGAAGVKIALEAGFNPFPLLDTWPGLFDRTRLDDPLVRLTVPALELASARDPGADRYFAVAVLGFVVPWMPAAMRPFVARGIWTADALRAGLACSQRNVRRLHDAGVPIVVGTDAPSPWDAAIQHFHGPTTLREIELLGEAGLPPAAALATATRTPAAMLGRAGELGKIEIGKRADLVIVREDPLADLRALRTIRWTVRDGVAPTPEEWMGWTEFRMESGTGIWSRSAS